MENGERRKRGQQRKVPRKKRKRNITSLDEKTPPTHTPPFPQKKENVQNKCINSNVGFSSFRRNMNKSSAKNQKEEKLEPFPPFLSFQNAHAQFPIKFLFFLFFSREFLNLDSLPPPSIHPFSLINSTPKYSSFLALIHNGKVKRRKKCLFCARAGSRSEEWSDCSEILPISRLDPPSLFEWIKGSPPIPRASERKRKSSFIQFRRKGER